MLVGMLRNALLVSFFVSGIAGLGGCHLYLDDGPDGERPDGEMWPDDCTEIGCEPDGERPDGERPDGDEPPAQSCESDDQCTRGCYCNEGLCEESSWCFRSSDCFEGFVCNRSGTCVPVADPPPADTCEGHDTEDACVADEACNPVYRGVNCTTESGEACTSNSANCSCESFAFDTCDDA
mgnify:CR=1 FL=1